MVGIDKLKSIKKALETPLYADLVEYLEDEYKTMSSIHNVMDLANAEDQAIEFKAQKKAATKLNDILSNLIGLKENEINEPNIEDRKKELGLK